MTFIIKTVFEEMEKYKAQLNPNPNPTYKANDSQKALKNRTKSEKIQKNDFNDRNSNPNQNNSKCSSFSLKINQKILNPNKQN